ncbi:hypothetical protein IQ41_11195 [Mycobacterium tuberculosis]|nr:hypothetical protein IQ47_11525 [Mycobacterium tuberculosis]KAK26121.1 hypothetical protein AZ55_15875 [Mycobacterium tuberculosis CWCFVRF MDRTB 670]KEY10021.1 hypothetical protein IB72_14280 [Mycobacterium tuberculosis variant bovis]BAQ06787.1 hypothetical protein KURONO_3004 [Mycobacterium tuberculosis str. Kurono]AIH52459.1 hypothetical protein IQ38_12000 [Mycobacterium tuberculosis]
MGAFASAATHPLGPHIDHLRAEAAHMPAPSISPPPQGVATSAAGADQLALSQGLLGRLGRTDDDHRVLRCA